MPSTSPIAHIGRRLWLRLACGLNRPVALRNLGGEIRERVSGDLAELIEVARTVRAEDG